MTEQIDWRERDREKARERVGASELAREREREGRGWRGNNWDLTPSRQQKSYQDNTISKNTGQ